MDGVDGVFNLHSRDGIDETSMLSSIKANTYRRCMMSPWASRSFLNKPVITAVVRQRLKGAPENR